MAGEELQELVRRADERDAVEGKPKYYFCCQTPQAPHARAMNGRYTLYSDEEMRELEEQIFNSDANVDEVEMDLQARAKWGHN